MLAKAKTGTGKTLSFLLPAIEGVARVPRAQRRGISVLIISPTRELAQQIADEANQVLVRGRRFMRMYIVPSRNLQLVVNFALFGLIQCEFVRRFETKSRETRCKLKLALMATRRHVNLVTR